MTRLIFAGTPEFAAPPLRALLEAGFEIAAVYTQPDRPAGRGRKLRQSPVKTLALKAGLLVRQPESLKPPQALQAFADLRADLMIVAAYGLILPRDWLFAPRLGCINIHASQLPRWRGAAPIARAILAGDRETGVTVMQMAPSLDTGDVLLKRSCPIRPQETAGELHDRLALLGAEAAVEAIDGLASGRLKPEPQDDAKATYAPKIGKAEAELDWRQSADDLARRVRAFNPWPVARTRYAGKPLRVWQARALNKEATDEAPGMIVAVTRAGVDVAAGAGILRLTTVQPAGGRAMPAADFARARRLAGVRLPD